VGFCAQTLQTDSRGATHFTAALHRLDLAPAFTRAGNWRAGLAAGVYVEVQRPTGNRYWYPARVEAAEEAGGRRYLRLFVVLDFERRSFEEIDHLDASSDRICKLGNPRRAA